MRATTFNDQRFNARNRTAFKGVGALVARMRWRAIVIPDRWSSATKFGLPSCPNPHISCLTPNRQRRKMWGFFYDRFNVINLHQMRIRRIDLTFTALLIPLDFVALVGAGMAAYLLRFSRFVTEVLPVLQNVPFSEYLRTVITFAFVWMVLFALAGLYSTRQKKPERVRPHRTCLYGRCHAAYRYGVFPT